MNILIIDAHPLFRAGLTEVLELLEVGPTVHEARSLDEFEQQGTGSLNLDLVLADLPSSEPEPIRRVGALVTAFGNVPVVITSEVEHRQCVLDAISSGAQGFIPKSAPHDEFAKGVRLVLDGSIYLSKRCLKNDPPPVKTVSLGHRGLSEIDGYGDLTNRQRETLALLAKGGTNNEIGEALGISDKTVRFHVSAILRVLRVRSRTEAALIASRALHNSQIELLACAS
jgi:DNA-binding NarL/FixJ family response regulator